MNVATTNYSAEAAKKCDSKYTYGTQAIEKINKSSQNAVKKIEEALFEIL